MKFPSLKRKNAPTEHNLRGGPDATLLAAYRGTPPKLATRTALYVGMAAIFLVYGFLHGLTAPFQIMPMSVPLVVMALVIIWVLPARENTPWRALEPLFLAFFAALMIWPDYLAISVANLPWITLKRLFAAPMALILLVCISVSGRFRRYLGAVVNSDRWIWKAIVFWIVLQTFSIFISWAPDRSLSKWVVYQTNWTLIFFVSCFLFSRPGFAIRWAYASVVLGYGICVFGLWEARIGTVPWAGHIPAFMRIEDEAVLRTLAGAVRSAKGLHRVQSISTTPLGMAELLGLIAPFALYFALSARNLLVRIGSALYLPVALQLVLLADSRLGMVALLGSVLFYVLIWGALRWRRDKGSLMAPTLVLSYPAIFSVALLSTFLIGRIRTRIWSDGSQQSSNDARATQWEMGVPKFTSHPFGHGIGGAATNLGYVQPGGLISIDSYYLTLLMDLGFLGFIVFFVVFLRAIWVATRTAIERQVEGELSLLLPLAVSLTNFVIIKSVLSQDANHPYAFMMLGAVVALAYRASREAPESSSASVDVRSARPLQAGLLAGGPDQASQIADAIRR